MVSGRTKEFLFAQTTTAGEVAHYVFEHWPTGWGNIKKIFKKLKILIKI